MPEIPEDVNTTIAMYVKSKGPVCLKETDETGILQWAVCIDTDRDFWLDSFSTEEEAREFCVTNNLPITEVLKQDEIKSANEMTDEEAIDAIKELMDVPGMEELCGLTVLNWHVFTIIKQEMARVCKGKLTPELFHALTQGLGATAMQSFDINNTRKQVKKTLLPWVQEVTKRYSK